MPKRDLLHEWMHRFTPEYSTRTIRVWTRSRHRHSIKRPNSSEFDDQNRAIERVINRYRTGQVDEILDVLARLPFVNAVEITDAIGNGRLVYVDWP